MLSAGYCPAGQMPVAIGNGFGGVIFHEACGHSLEASAVALGQSQFAGKLGQQIATTKVTAIDDGTIPNAWGSINIDDEGTPAQRNVLIENGILKSYMIDKFNGRRMGMRPPRAAAAARLLPLRADFPHDQHLYSRRRGFRRGYYWLGGLWPLRQEDGRRSVNPVTGEFNFAVSEGYLVRNGQIASRCAAPCWSARGLRLCGILIWSA